MSQKRTSNPAGAASATYRKAVNGIADALGREAVHSTRPSLDLDLALDGIPDALRGKAIEWYERGVSRGLSKATDMMAEGAITFDGNHVHAPREFLVRVRTRFAGSEWESRELRVRATDIGFNK